MCTCTFQHPLPSVTLQSRAESSFLVSFTVSTANGCPTWVIIIITSCFFTSSFSQLSAILIYSKITLAEGQLWVMLLPCLISSLRRSRFSNSVKISWLSIRGLFRTSLTYLATSSPWMFFLRRLSDSAKLGSSLFPECTLHFPPLCLSPVSARRSPSPPFISAYRYHAHLPGLPQILPPVRCCFLITPTECHLPS